MSDYATPVLSVVEGLIRPARCYWVALDCERWRKETKRIYLKARILPAFGRMPLDRIGPEEVAA